MAPFGDYDTYGINDHGNRERTCGIDYEGRKDDYKGRQGDYRGHDGYYGGRDEVYRAHDGIYRGRGKTNMKEDTKMDYHEGKDLKS